MSMLSADRATAVMLVPGASCGESSPDQPCQPVSPGLRLAQYAWKSVPTTNASIRPATLDTAPTCVLGAATPPLSGVQPCQPAENPGAQDAVSTALSGPRANASSSSVAGETAVTNGLWATLWASVVSAASRTVRPRSGPVAGRVPTVASSPATISTAVAGPAARRAILLTRSVRVIYCLPVCPLWTMYGHRRFPQRRGTGPARRSILDGPRREWTRVDRPQVTGSAGAQPPDPASGLDTAGGGANNHGTGRAGPGRAGPRTARRPGREPPGGLAANRPAAWPRWTSALEVSRPRRQPPNLRLRQPRRGE